MYTLIDFVDPYGGEGLHAQFSHPLHLLCANQLSEVLPLLQAVSDYGAQGLWCVGYVRYEAAPAFDSACQVHPHTDGLPLAWFGVYQQALPPGPPSTEPSPPLSWQAGQTREAFDTSIHTIHQAIRSGDVYQVNYTSPLHASLPPDTQEAAMRAWFDALRRAQPDAYAAHIDTDQEIVLSVSPELFFDWRGDQLLMRPMKGTARRGKDAQDDASRADALRASPKEQAENVMIVDLVRNDISRIALPHSVQVPRLFQLQGLPTVWQMTSDVQAQTRPGTSLVDVFKALFPCGSITGAPKLQAMRLIRQLEPQARGLYCGAIGVVRPGGHATFNVAIRTISARKGVAQCGIGSGITADASAQGEWDEWRAKRGFLERTSQEFELLETLALDSGQYRHLDLHLQRMQAAAQHFAYDWDAMAVKAALAQLAARYPEGLHRVRMRSNAQGQVTAQAFALQQVTQSVQLRLAKSPMQEAHSEFVRFKTTRRAHYDAFAPTDPVDFDTLLCNADGQLTECTRGNIALLIDGQWLTPP
ncbi:MAG: aminodeoxychorismate synthase component I, partial [Rhodoferax sp.]|nr:aminodeoxychorismate synthase component I [Rhodoferax sp.]